MYFHYNSRQHMSFWLLIYTVVHKMKIMLSDNVLDDCSVLDFRGNNVIMSTRTKWP